MTENLRAAAERFQAEAFRRQAEAALAGGAEPAGQTGQVRHTGGMSGAALDGVLFGGGDEYLAGLAAAFGVQPDGQGGARWFQYDLPIAERYETALNQIRAEQRAYSDENPGRALTAELTGALSTALVPAGQIGAATRMGSTPARMATGAAAGGAMAGIYGFNEGEGGVSNRAEGAADAAPFGALFGATAPLIGRGLEAYLNRRAGTTALRNAASQALPRAELRAAGNALYQRADDAGVAVAPEAFRSMSARLTAEMLDGGLDATQGRLGLTPNSARLAQLLDEAAQQGDGIPLSTVQRLRQQAQIPAGDIANRTEAALGSRAVAALDDFMENLSPDQVSMGNGEAASAALSQARDVWARLRRSELLEEVIDRAQNYRSGPEAGLRAGFQSLLNNRRLMRGFSEAEVAAMRRVVNSRDFNTILRQLGRFGLALNGGSSGLGAALGAGAGGIAGGPIGAIAVPAAATAARLASERATTNAAQLARNVVAAGGVQNLPVVSPAPRNALEAILRRGGAVASN